MMIMCFIWKTNKTLKTMRKRFFRKDVNESRRKKGMTKKENKPPEKKENKRP
jgi:hypothetical protein